MRARQFHLTRAKRLMSEIPKNRKHFGSAANVPVNVGSVASALVLRREVNPSVETPVSSRQVAPPNASDLLIARVGSFVGAVCGISVGLVLGSAVGIIAAPLVAGLAVIALAIGLAILGGYVGSGGGGWAVLGGGILGAWGGTHLGMWAGAYVVIGTPILLALVGAYHCSVHGVGLGERLAQRAGVVSATFRLALVAGLCISALWVGVVSLGQFVDIFAALEFVAGVTCAVVALLVGISVMLVTLGSRHGDRVRLTLPTAVLLCLATCGIPFFFSRLPTSINWTKVTLPSEMTRPWTESWNQPSEPTAGTLPMTDIRVLKLNSHIRSGPGRNFASVTTRPPGTEVTLLSVDPNGSWVKVRLSDGTEGYVSRKLIGQP